MIPFPLQKRMETKNEYGFVCIHWSLGGLVLIGLAASEYSGAGTVIALPISAAAGTISALCGLYYLGKGSGKRKFTDVVDFFVVWFNILEFLMAAATCARVASATVDYTSEEKLRVWLFGIESHSLGEPWPDVLGVAVIAVVSALFMFGLEKSSLFCALLYFTICSAYVVFVTVGASQTDIRFWNWTEDFMNRSWSCVLVTAALCSYGFVNNFSRIDGKGAKAVLCCIVPLICYSLITLVFTLMSHYREIAGTAIPLVRIFEVRDVGWAKLAMAACTICVSCLLLTEIMPAVYDLLLSLARRNWQILVPSILYRSNLTGAPVLVIFTAGSLTSILAFACPLSYLVRLLNVSVLLKSSLISAIVTYNCYKSSNSPASEVFSFHNHAVQYCKLSQDGRPVRSTSSVLPRWPRKGRKSEEGNQGDREYLLLDKYGHSSSDACDARTSSESEDEKSEEMGNVCEESSSSTDVDVAVQEYKDKIKVSTSGTYSDLKPPGLVHRIVAIFIILIVHAASVHLSLSISNERSEFCWLVFIVLCICMVTLCLMPKYIPEERQASKLYPILPYLGLVSIVLNMVLATVLLHETWPGILFWTTSGFMLFWHWGCCYCDEKREGVTIYRRTDSSLVDVDDSDERQVETVIIPR